ncbi:ATP-binding protein [Streptomyces wedmorensis]|uniref:ATP-binding protein n=1 Tax=Streptomyces wedmorensis TaxID=43759 RepID=UPI0037B0133E
MPEMWTRGEGHDARLVERLRGGCDLVGRDGELSALRAALSAHRLVTVTGAVGTGKSSLARTVLAPTSYGPCRATVPVRWHDGIPVGRRALTGRIARALSASGPPQDATGTDITAVVRSFPPGDVLLLLDDVDPVHTECVGLVQTLLMALPALRVLVTARRPLGLGDEKVVHLGPLRGDAAPARGAARERAAERTPALSPAAELLLSRARERGWSEEAPDPAAVAHVCRLLEGVPLALELAAARLGECTLAELAAHIEDDQCRLADPAPVLRRHRSLRTAVGAVHALCEPAARTVWRRVSVFAGPFTEAAAVFVCADSGLAPRDVPPALALLTATGVLQVLGDPGAVRRPRYRMARSARDFGTERLTAAGELPVTRDRHGVHFRGVAAVAETLWNTGLQRQALQAVHEEHDDLTALVRRGTGLAGAAVTDVDLRGPESTCAEATDPDPAGLDLAAPAPARPDLAGTDPAAADPSGASPPGPDLIGPAPARPDLIGPPPARPDLAGPDPARADPTGHAETALETVLHLWFWWTVHDHAAEGSAHLSALLPRLPADSALVARGRWLAAWLCAGEDPRGAQHLLDLAWPVAVLDGDEALVGRIAHVHGILAWERRDVESAAAYYREAADTVPIGAPGGPPPMVSLAALAVVQAHHIPAAAVRTARRALAQETGRNDAWATALAHYAHALADHRAGRVGRARHRALRALADLESRVDAPRARTALRRLLTSLDPVAVPSRAPVPQYRPPARPHAGLLPRPAGRRTVPTALDQVE